MSDPQRALAFLLVLSAVAIVLRLVSRRAPVPYQVLLAIGGILIGLIPGVPTSIVGPDLILLVFVPGLVFEAVIALDIEQLRRVALPVALLATLGVALTVVVIAAGAHLLLGLRWSDGFLLGAIVAPTDPIATVSVLRRLHAPGALTALLEGESLVNDGTGVAVFAAVLASITGSSFSAGDVGLRFLLIAGGGIAVGLVVGAVGTLVLRAFRDPQSEILTSVAIAYGSYLAADVAKLSGVVAVVTAGVVVVAAARRTPVHSREMVDFWSLAGFLLNAFLFVLIGTALPTTRLAGLAGPLFAGFGIMLAARLLPAYALLAATDVRARRMPWRWRHLVFVGGLRGALSVALALSVAHEPGVDPLVAPLAYGITVLSLLLQGALVPTLAARLGLSGRQERKPAGV